MEVIDKDAQREKFVADWHAWFQELKRAVLNNDKRCNS